MVDSTMEAVDESPGACPLYSVDALLSPRDEDALIAHSELCRRFASPDDYDSAVPHCRGKAPEKKGGCSGEVEGPRSDGCDPMAFAEEVVGAPQGGVRNP